jgi:hypothetical protein
MHYHQYIFILCFDFASLFHVQRGRTAMSFARAKGHSAIVDLLTANGAVNGDYDDDIVDEGSDADNDA